MCIRDSPETGYLKLSKRQIRECKKQFELKGSLPHTLDAEVSITLFASFLLFLLSLFIAMAMLSMAYLIFNLG